MLYRVREMLLKTGGFIQRGEVRLSAGFLTMSKPQRISCTSGAEVTDISLRCQYVCDCAKRRNAAWFTIEVETLFITHPSQISLKHAIIFFCVSVNLCAGVCGNLLDSTTFILTGPQPQRAVSVFE